MPDKKDDRECRQQGGQRRAAPQNISSKIKLHGCPHGDLPDGDLPANGGFAEQMNISGTTASPRFFSITGPRIDLLSINAIARMAIAA
jgi:hypothetical protein